MEFNEKIQELRRQKGMTQEELASALYVSRAAVSKWESGRGYPSIDSLKQMAAFFGVTVDELLSGDELLNLAEEDNKQHEHRLHNLVFGLLDVSVSMLLFLPFFAQRAEGLVTEVSLLSLSVSPYLRIGYLTFVCLTALMGVLTLALQNFTNNLWIRCKSIISLALSSVGVFLLIIGLQPYAAILLFAFLLIKLLMLVKLR